jgi:hypothetical protein
MVLPHSPGQNQDLTSMAQSNDSKSGQSIIKKLVAGRNPFSSSARRRLDPAQVPPRSTSLTGETATPSSGHDNAFDHRDVGAARANQADEQVASSNAILQTSQDSMPTSTQPTLPELTNTRQDSMPTPPQQTLPESTNTRQDSVPVSNQQMLHESSSLKEQRQDLVGEVVEEARQNKKPPLDEAGRETFKQAGFSERIDTKGDVEVDTRWLKPVIQVSLLYMPRSDWQETIIHKEHTEYTTVIDREIHIHHI